jgi:fructokinase
MSERYSERYWGIDLGGTKIEGAVLASTERPEPLCRIRVPTESEGGYGHIIDQVALLVDKMRAETGQSPQAIGMGTPGVLDPKTGTLKNSNTTCLNGQPLQDDLQKALGLEVRLANDANCFALAEARLGAGRGAETVFGVIMGTGVGGGIVIDERALYGGQGIAGEWGHNLLDAAGPDCYCGRKGCVETLLSGPALERVYAGLAGEERSLADIAARRVEDAHAAATLDHLLDYFGQAMACLINILDPHVIVLGGGVSNVDLLYSEGPTYVAKYVFNDRLDTKIVQHELGDSAGVFGAAMLVA